MTHPLRCETCQNKDCDLHADNPGNINSDTGQTYNHFQWYYAIIDKKGCASHSSAPVPEGYLVTDQELNFIKNDCAHPETISCEGCEFTSDGANPCTWKGANILMDEILERRPYNEQSIRQDEREQWKKYIKSFHEEDPLLMAYSDGYKSGKKDATEKVLDKLEKSLREYERVGFVDVMCEIEELRQGKDGE